MRSYWSLWILIDPDGGYGFYWVLMCPYWSSFVPMDSNASQRVLIGPYAFLWVLMGPYVSIWNLIGFYGPSCVLMGPYVSLLVFMRLYGSFCVLLFCLCFFQGS